MRLGQVIHADPLGRGGIQTHVRLLCEDLAARGHEVHALAHQVAARPQPPRVVAQDGWSYELRTRAGGTPFGEPAIERHLAHEVVQWARSRRLQVVHVHHLSGCGALAVSALQAAGLAVVVSVHDFEHVCPRGQMWSDEGRCVDLELARCTRCTLSTWPAVPAPADPQQALHVRRKRALRALASADALVAPSAAGLDLYRQRMPELCHANWTVVENGIRAARLRRQVRALRSSLAGSPAGTVRMGIVGAVQPSKGVLPLAQAVVALACARTSGPSLELWIHGTPTAAADARALWQQLQQLAAQHVCVRLHGGFDAQALPRILAQLDVLAAPALWDEIHGLSVREGLAAELWTVATERGGLAALAHEHAGALQLPADEPATWASALAQALPRWVMPPRAVPLPREAAQCAREMEALYATVGAAARRHTSSTAAAATFQS